MLDTSVQIAMTRKLNFNIGIGSMKRERMNPPLAVIVARERTVAIGTEPIDAILATMKDVTAARS